MNHVILNLKQAAQLTHTEERDLLHLAQRGEAPGIKRGESFVFDSAELHSWYQRRLLEMPLKDLYASHAGSTKIRLRSGSEDLVATKLLHNGSVHFITAKTKGGVIRDIADIAGESGYIYDPADYYKALVEREEAASTALPGGIAFLHAGRHDPYHASESFIIVCKTASPVFFGAPDDEPTDIFFLLCCTDGEEHLHALGRLAVLAATPGFIEEIRAAQTPAEITSALEKCECAYLNRK